MVTQLCYLIIYFVDLDSARQMSHHADEGQVGLLKRHFVRVSVCLSLWTARVVNETTFSVRYNSFQRSYVEVDDCLPEGNHIHELSVNPYREPLEQYVQTWSSQESPRQRVSKCSISFLPMFLPASRWWLLYIFLLTARGKPIASVTATNITYSKVLSPEMIFSMSLLLNEPHGESDAI